MTGSAELIGSVAALPLRSRISEKLTFCCETHSLICCASMGAAITSDAVSQFQPASSIRNCSS